MQARERVHDLGAEHGTRGVVERRRAVRTRRGDRHVAGKTLHHVEGPLENGGIVLEPRGRRGRDRNVGERVENAELRLEVVGLEESRHRLALGDVATSLAPDLHVERERLLGEALGAALEPRHARLVAEAGGDETFKAGLETVVRHVVTQG